MGRGTYRYRCTKCGAEIYWRPIRRLWAHVDLDVDRDHIPLRVTKRRAPTEAEQDEMEGAHREQA